MNNYNVIFLEQFIFFNKIKIINEIFVCVRGIKKKIYFGSKKIPQTYRESYYAGLHSGTFHVCFCVVLDDLEHSRGGLGIPLFLLEFGSKKIYFGSKKIRIKKKSAGIVLKRITWAHRATRAGGCFARKSTV